MRRGRHGTVFDVSRVDEVGAREGWRCWLCDEPVDPQMSVNDPRGPSVDGITTKTSRNTQFSKAKPSKTQSKGKADVQERLAHRACNTKKGAITAVAPWPDHLFVVDAAPIIETVDGLRRKGGRVVVARCPTLADGEAAARWLEDRLSRLSPDMELQARVEPGGGQFIVVLHT